MSVNKDRLESLHQERAAIVRSGHITWIHWLIVVLSLVLTVVAWQFSKRQIEEKTEAEFERTSGHIVELITDRMQKYEDGLWGGVSAIQTHGGDIGLHDWRVFAESLRIGAKYPGINGVGVIHHVLPENLNAYLAAQRLVRPDYAIHPKHAEKEFLPITYIEPSSTNAKAIGLDIAHETNRYAAALKARDTGVAQITGPIVLVQDNEKTPGFLFYAPFYEGGVYPTVQERQEHFTGLVYAPFVFHKLIDGLLGQERRNVRIRVRDGEEILYDERKSDRDRESGPPTFTSEVALDLYGRTWSIDIWTTPAFDAGVSSNQPLVILIGGVFIDSLLLTLFILLSGANRRAIDFADRATRELSDKMAALSKSNEELEQFAYVTSHDLKTPLRGIGDLLEYLEEDLDAYLSASEANPDVRRNLERLNHQVRRMDSLIQGILT